MHRDEIPTPALLLDLTAFEANLRAMTTFVAARGKALRPHGKTHKCPEIARRLVAAGAVGTCTAKLGEAEVFAAHGLRGLLVTTAVIGKDKAARAAALARIAPDTIVVADDLEAVRVLGDAAWRAKVTMRVAVDLYFGRTGVPPGEAARDVARAIDGLPGLTLRGPPGLRCRGLAHRAVRGAQGAQHGSMTAAVETARLIEQDGIPCPLVTGGSTGTYRIDAELEGVTELQPGSFLFMDSDYGRHRRRRRRRRLHRFRSRRSRSSPRW